MVASRKVKSFWGTTCIVPVLSQGRGEDNGPSLYRYRFIVDAVLSSTELLIFGRVVLFCSLFVCVFVCLCVVVFFFLCTNASYSNVKKRNPIVIKIVIEAHFL